MLKGEKILVTGPAGQVAFPVCKTLAKENEVVGIARFSNPDDRARVEAAGVRAVKLDMGVDSFDALDDDFTYVLNFAVVKSPDDNFDYDLAVNGEGTGRLMYHTRKAKAFLHCSSTAVYRPTGGRKLKETDRLGDSHVVMGPGMATYSISKIASEVVARFACVQLGLPTVIARLNVPFGDNGGWPYYHLLAMMAGLPVPVHPSLGNYYAPIHEDDVDVHVEELLAAASVPALTLNWGGSEEASIEEWCAHMGELTGLEPKFDYTEQALGSISPDPELMHQHLSRTTVPWKDGLRRMIEARNPELLRR